MHRREQKEAGDKDWTRLTHFRPLYRKDCVIPMLDNISVSVSNLWSGLIVTVSHSLHICSAQHHSPQIMCARCQSACTHHYHASRIETFRIPSLLFVSSLTERKFMDIIYCVLLPNMWSAAIVFKHGNFCWLSLRSWPRRQINLCRPHHQLVTRKKWLHSISDLPRTGM